LFSPPFYCVWNEHPGAMKCPLAAGGFNDLLDLQAEISSRVGLLEKRMRRFQGCGEEDDAPNLSQIFFQSRSDGRRRGDPNKKDCFDSIQTGIQSFRLCEIASDEFGLTREVEGFGVARQHTNRHPAFP